MRLSAAHRVTADDTVETSTTADTTVTTASAPVGADLRHTIAYSFNNVADIRNLQQHCYNNIPQPFPFLLQGSLYAFPRLFTVILSISVFLPFSFFLFLHFFSCRFRAVD